MEFSIIFFIFLNEGFPNLVKKLFLFFSDDAGLLFVPVGRGADLAVPVPQEEVPLRLERTRGRRDRAARRCDGDGKIR